MYNRMYLTGGRQLEFICNLTDLLQDQIRTKIFETQFMVSMSMNRLLHIGLELDITQSPT
jgi:hypothetical protein